MAVTFIGRFLNNLRETHKHVARCNIYPGIFVQTREYAARKGTREKAAKLKRKNELAKKARVARERRKIAEKPVNAYVDDNCKPPLPDDDVWMFKFFQMKTYSFAEAIKCHRETHHPTIYNIPDAEVRALVELNMQGKKQGKYVNAFTRVVNVPHSIYDESKWKKVIAFSKTSEEHKIAENAGAALSGGTQLIKDIQAGTISLRDYDCVVAHPNILSELLIIRGLLDKKYPTKTAGTLGDDIADLVQTFTRGIIYTARQHPVQKDYGIINVVFGSLNMDTEKLKENLVTIIKNIEEKKPLKDQDFIRRVQIYSLATSEGFKIDIKQCLQSGGTKEEEEEELDIEDAIIATN